MYYIYHIPNVKWGCTNNLTRRKKQQSNYNITEWIEEEDLDKADALEKKLNIDYGYPWNDSQSYKQMLSLDRSYGGSASSKKKWETNRDKMLEQCKRSGKKSHQLGVGFHSFTSEEHSKNGSKGFANGLGKLPMKKRKEFLKRAHEARLKSRKFTKEEVQWIRKVFKPYHKEYGVVPLAKKYNVHENSIRGIIKYKFYKDY